MGCGDSCPDRLHWRQLKLSGLTVLASQLYGDAHRPTTCLEEGSRVMKRALGLALAGALLLSTGVAAQEAEVPAPWDESETIAITRAENPAIIGMSSDDFCRSMAWLLEQYKEEPEPSEDQIAFCADMVEDYMDGQAWVPDIWLPLINEADAVAPDEPATEQASQPKTANSYKELSKRQWQRLMKAPDKYTGKRYVVFACITQFDAATGEDSFRGQASSRKQRYWYTDGDNAFFMGNARKLDAFVQGDIVRMKVESLGSLSYETQIGGETTVPVFSVDAIKRQKGSCD